MIILTGAAGFIGSCLLSKLNQEGFCNICIVDDFTTPAKNRNIENKNYQHKIAREDFFKWINNTGKGISFVFHIGARTDTTEFDKKVFDKLNFDYSVNVWNLCVKNNIPLVYASSAATYGMGEHGFADSHGIVEKLRPLNPYGESKNEFDKWVLKQRTTPPFWAGLKFFNVYGPNEYHKDRMASVIFHAYRQIKQNGSMKLFRSHNPHYKDGEQLRDFIYVKDVMDICYFLMQNKVSSGLYNIGTGTARTFYDLAASVFKALNLNPNIHFVDTPIDIRDKYQYFTEAKMEKLKQSGYNKSFFSLEDGIKDYVQNYLAAEKYY